MKSRLKEILITSALILFAGLIYFFRTINLGRADAVPAHLEIMNPTGQLAGPEGIQFDTRGNIFVSTSQGLVWVVGAGENPRIYAQLDKVRPLPGVESSGEILAGGMDFDRDGNLYVAAFGFGGGSILRVDAGTREVRFFAQGLGVINSLAITGDGRNLWATDYRMRGRLLRFALKGPLPTQPDLAVGGVSHPNGLAFGKEDKVLYTDETYAGNIARVDLTSPKPVAVYVANLKGRLAVASLDGLAFDPRDANRRFLYVAENLRGLFSVLDLQAQPVRVLKRISAAQMGGRPCPASLAIRDGFLYFTDIWSCNPLRILLGFPNYHQFVYRLKVVDMSMVY